MPHQDFRRGARSGQRRRGLCMSILRQVARGSEQGAERCVAGRGGAAPPMWGAGPTRWPPDGGPWEDPWGGARILPATARGILPIAVHGILPVGGDRGSSGRGHGDRIHGVQAVADRRGPGEKAADRGGWVVGGRRRVGGGLGGRGWRLGGSPAGGAQGGRMRELYSRRRRAGLEAVACRWSAHGAGGGVGSGRGGLLPVGEEQGRRGGLPPVGKDGEEHSRKFGTGAVVGRWLGSGGVHSRGRK